MTVEDKNIKDCGKWYNVYVIYASSSSSLCYYFIIIGKNILSKLCHYGSYVTICYFLHRNMYNN